jgi:uncharacterized membrane protein YidH (DUF202 family)
MMAGLPNRAGLQPERTALAWQRTSITASVIMVPLIVVNARLGSWLMTVLGSVAAVVAGVLVVRVRRRFSELRGGSGPFSPFDPMVRVAVVTSLAAVGGLVTALVVLGAGVDLSWLT